MKFSPYGLKSNVSATRNRSSNVSMKVDGRGLPHLTWLESKNGHNEIDYKYWDGQQWTYHQSPVVGWAEEELVSSGNSLILGSEEKPYIAFSKRLPNSQSTLTVATTQEEGWLLDEITAAYDTKWIGIIQLNYGSNFTSSSSSGCCVHPICTSTFGAGCSHFTNWTFSGMNSTNSDNCMLYVETHIHPSLLSQVTVNIYKDSPPSYKVAYGEGPAGTIAFSEYNSSGLSGTVDWDGLAQTTVITLDCGFGSSSSSSSSFDSSSSNSSSSSIDSSSSSSADDGREFVVTYDSNILRVYVIRPSGWYLLGQKTTIISNSSSLKIVNAGKYIGITWYEGDLVCYNFFNLNEEVWRYDTAQTITINGLAAIDVDGYAVEEDGYLLFATVTQETTQTKINNITANTNGVISYLGSQSLIESETVYVTGDNDYVSSGYSDISVSLDPVTGYFNIVVLGGRITKYTFNGTSWSKTYESIDGMSDGISPNRLMLKSYNNTNNIAFSNMGGDVYCFVENNTERTSIIYPDISIFNEQRFYLAQYKDGRLDGTEIPCTWWERVGDILREGKTRVNVIVTDGEDPWCYSSSSSSERSSSSYISSISSSSSCTEICTISYHEMIPSGNPHTPPFEKRFSLNNCYPFTIHVALGSRGHPDQLIVYADKVVLWDTGCVSCTGFPPYDAVGVTSIYNYYSEGQYRPVVERDIVVPRCQILSFYVYTDCGWYDDSSWDLWIHPIGGPVPT